MAKRPPKPQLKWDELYASTDFTLLVRFTRGDDNDVIVNARENGTLIEIWVQDTKPATWQTRELRTFVDPDEATAFVKETTDKYIADGWTIVDSRKGQR